MKYAKRTTKTTAKYIDTILNNLDIKKALILIEGSWQWQQNEVTDDVAN